MKYIVTGSTGHIGNNIVRRLKNNVKVLLRSDNDLALFGLNVEKVIGDLSDEVFLEREIDGDVLIHLAGIIDITNKNKNIYKVNYEMTKKIADICFKKKIRFIYVSSVDALDKPKKGIIEHIILNPENLKSNYGKSKAMASLYVLSLMKKGFNASIVYPSAVIGPYDFKVSPIGLVIKKIKENKKMPIIKGKYNFVDVRDVADCIINLANNNVVDSYLITGDILTVEQLIETICSKLNKRKPISLPMWSVNIGARVLPIYCKIRNQQPTFTKFALETLNSNCLFSFEKTKKDLGYDPRDPYESLIDMIDWYLKNEPL